jgi:transcriptional regulator with XRE-family HTH domain
MIEEIIDSYKQYQIDNKLTQQEAADKVHISRTHLSRIFNKERTPSIALLKRMEDVMKIGYSSKK